MENRGRLEKGTEIDFILAGKATFTVRNTETGNRFTFQVIKAKPQAGQTEEQAPWFVRVLTSGDNENGYSYLGTIFGRNYRHGRKSRISEGAQSEKVFSWIWGKVNNGGLPEMVEVWHEGTCGRCGRKLTVPESIESGIGPVCSDLMMKAAFAEYERQQEEAAMRAKWELKGH